MNDPIIRIADIEDLSVLVDIYNQAIRSKRATGDLTEFTVSQRLPWFKKHSPDNYPIYVASERSIIGYCAISPRRPQRQGLKDTAEISYYVDYQHHGKGIGSKLINYAIDDCKRIGIKNLLAIIQEWNTSSISILTKFGFEKWGFFPNVVNINGEKCGQFIYGKNL